MLEHDLAITLVMLVQDNAGMWTANELRQLGLAVLNRRPALPGGGMRNVSLFAKLL